MELFPYPLRPGQDRLMSVARDALQRGSHALVESGTGTGKTVAALTAALEVALPAGKRILYLTRTNSQSRQVIEEVRAIRERGGLPLTVVALQGRSHLCTLAKHDPEFGRATSEELATLCRDARGVVDAEREGKRRRGRACEPYRRTTPGALETAHGWIRDHAPTAEDLVTEMEDRGVCPYIVTRDLLPEARVVVAPYVYLFQPFLRRALLQWMGASLEDLLVVVDEAHNLPDHLRSLASASLSVRGIQLARGEAREMGNVALPGDVTLVELLDHLRRTLEALAQEHIPRGEEDGLLPPGALEVELLPALATTSRTLEAALKLMLEYGESVREKRRDEGRTPRSYVGSVAAFLLAYRDAEELGAGFGGYGEPDPTATVKLVVGGENATVELACLDPAPTAAPLLETAGSLHMSGTLRPLEMYRDTLGLPHDAVLEVVPSPFPPSNRLVLLDDRVTTRYEEVTRDPGMWRRIAEAVREVREAAPHVNAAVFLPSYDALHRVAEHLPEGFALVDGGGSDQRTLMDLVDGFRARRGATLLSVLGGRVSEGLDFPDEALELVLVVGLPYPRPTARERALKRFYDLRFDRGWAYAVHAPMAQRVLQAVGRLIRSADDRGVAVLLDHRAKVLAEELPTLQGVPDVAATVGDFLTPRRPGPSEGF